MWINYQFMAVCPLILNFLHISSQKWLVFGNYFGLSNFLPQLANFFTRIYLSYPWHFATLAVLGKLRTMSTPHAFQQFSAFWDKLFAENPKKLRLLVTRVTRFLDVWEWEEFSRFLIRKNLILLVSSVRLVLSALPLRIRSPRFREVSGIGTISTVITIVLPIWGNSYNTLLYSSKVKWSWSMCLFYSQYEIISPRHIFLFFIPIALFFFPTLYLYILLIRCRKNLQIIVSSLLDPPHR